jgi:hypothetical protein
MSAETYRKIAAKLRAKAAPAPTAILAAEWDNLAKCYLRLAEQADNDSSGIWVGNSDGNTDPDPPLENNGD